MGTWSPHNETDPYLINTSNSLMGLIHLQEYKEVPFVTRSQWSYSRGQALFSVLSSAHTPLQSQCALSGQNRKSLSRTDFYYSRCAEHYLLDWEERVFKSTQIISLSADIPSFSFNYSIYIFTYLQHCKQNIGFFVTILENLLTPTSSILLTVSLHWGILLTKVEVVGEVKSSRVSRINSGTVIIPGILNPLTKI